MKKRFYITLIAILLTSCSHAAQIYNPQPAPDDIFDAQGIPMRVVPAGEFTMGSDKGFSDAKPPHTVFLDAYMIDKYEVTNALYAVCVSASKCDPPKENSSHTTVDYYSNMIAFANYPVIYVNWEMAKTYCEWRGARLPTEAEWEKAARGTDNRTYPWGEGIDMQHANYDSKDPTLIGSYPSGASPYGVYDMAGNVLEWTADWYTGDYYTTLGQHANNPTGPASGQARALRGGSWDFVPSILRVSYRSWYGPSESYNDVGFRCAR